MTSILCNQPHTHTQKSKVMAFYRSFWSVTCAMQESVTCLMICAKIACIRNGPSIYSVGVK